jgi:uncharacterized protein involved in type VI secretion and phage assembly
MESDAYEQVLDWVRSHYFGKYRGTVSENADPTSRGRIKVKVPALLGDLEVWAMACVPYAGKGVGFYSIPEPGTGVWIEFEGGDLSYPVWTGCWWADAEVPDKAGPPVKIWKTESLTVRLDDGEKQALVKNTSGCSIKLAADVVTKSGNARHAVAKRAIVSQVGAGKVEVTSGSVRVNGGALEVI